LAERVARSLSLASNRQFLEAFDLDADEGIVDGSSRQAVQRISELLLERVSVTPISGSSLFEVSFTSPEPSLSATIAAAWIDEFIASSIERRFASTNDARGFLQEQLVQLRQRLEDSERQFVAYASNSGIISVPGPGGQVSEENATLVGTDLAAMNTA